MSWADSMAGSLRKWWSKDHFWAGWGQSKWVWALPIRGVNNTSRSRRFIGPSNSEETWTGQVTAVLRVRLLPHRWLRSIQLRVVQGVLHTFEDHRHIRWRRVRPRSKHTSFADNANYLRIRHLAASLAKWIDRSKSSEQSVQHIRELSHPNLHKYVVHSSRQVDWKYEPVHRRKFQLAKSHTRWRNSFGRVEQLPKVCEWASCSHFQATSRKRPIWYINNRLARWSTKR